MRVIPFPPAQAAVVAACDEAGVVLEFVLIESQEMDVQDEWTHRLAAVAAVDSVCRTLAGEIALQTEIATHEFRDDDGQLSEAARAAVEHWQKVAAQSADPARLRGRRIGLNELYGAGFDPARGELKAEATKFSGSEFDAAWSLTDAFVQTPYGLGLSGAPLRQLWNELVEKVLGRPDGSVPIYRWDGDWSAFFDAGREWWGAAAWTLARGDRELVVVCASTTD